MKNQFKIITKTLIIILITLCIVGCKNESKISESNPQNHKTNTAFPITLTDQMGREVTIEKLPERIISLAPSNTEILFTLGLEDRIVGVTDFCDYPEAAKSKEKIGGFSEPNIEKIISLQPDLILATSMHQKPVEELEKLNVPSVVLDPKDDLKARVKDVDDKVIKLTEDERPKVYYEIWPSPITTAGPGTFVNDIIQRAGGENIAKDAKKAYPQYSQEMIVAKNPDIIIFSHHGSSNQSAEDILNRQGWESIEAIKNNKVFYVEENLVQRATPRLVDGLEQLAMMMHPELFK